MALGIANSADRVDLLWLWTLAFVITRIACQRGYEAMREAAMAAFAEDWRRKR